MRNILVICPTSMEYSHFKNAVANNSTSSKFTVVHSGVGKVNAAVATALSIFNGSAPHYDLIAVIGYAAGCGSFQQGDFVCASKARYHDTDCPEDIVPELSTVWDLVGDDNCTVLTGDSFVTKDLAVQLKSKYNGNIIFDMEAAAVCQVADQAEIPVIVLKLISDVPTIDDNNAQTFAEFAQSNTDFSRFVWWLEAI